MSSSSSYSRFYEALNQRSEIYYVYAGIPTILMFFLSIVTAAVLHTNREEYFDCKADEDYLYGYLLGEIIFTYVFVLYYANLVTEIIKPLCNLVVTFVFFLLFMISNSGWALWGIDVMINTNCEDTVYYVFAGINIAVFVLFLLVMIAAGIYLFIASLCRRPRKEIIQPQGVELTESKAAIDENPDIVDVQDVPDNISQNEDKGTKAKSSPSDEYSRPAKQRQDQTVEELKQEDY